LLFVLILGDLETNLVWSNIVISVPTPIWLDFWEIERIWILMKNVILLLEIYLVPFVSNLGGLLLFLLAVVVVLLPDDFDQVPLILRTRQVRIPLELDLPLLDVLR